MSGSSSTTSTRSAEVPVSITGSSCRFQRHAVNSALVTNTLRYRCTPSPGGGRVALQIIRQTTGLSYSMRFCRSSLALALALACAPAQLPRGTEPVDLVIASTTDVHGRVTAWDYYANNPETIRGLTRAATIVDSIR